jgi:hypothetical protein
MLEGYNDKNISTEYNNLLKIVQNISNLILELKKTEGRDPRLNLMNKIKILKETYGFPTLFKLTYYTLKFLACEFEKIQKSIKEVNPNSNKVSNLAKPLYNIGEQYLMVHKAMGIRDENDSEGIKGYELTYDEWAYFNKIKNNIEKMRNPLQKAVNSAAPASAAAPMSAAVFASAASSAASSAAALKTQNNNNNKPRPSSPASLPSMSSTSKLSSKRPRPSSAASLPIIKEGRQTRTSLKTSTNTLNLLPEPTRKRKVKNEDLLYSRLPRTYGKVPFNEEDAINKKYEANLPNLQIKASALNVYPQNTAMTINELLRNTGNPNFNKTVLKNNDETPNREQFNRYTKEKTAYTLRNLLESRKKLKTRREMNKYLRMNVSNPNPPLARLIEQPYKDPKTVNVNKIGGRHKTRRTRKH